MGKYNMEFIWMENTEESFENIKGQYFSDSETIEYKLKLLERIEDKIQTLGTSTKVDKPEWKGSHKVLVDKFLSTIPFLRISKPVLLNTLNTRINVKSLW